MSDVLKIVEEALVAGLDLHIHDDNPDAVEQRIRAALTALRGLEWRPIAEMKEYEEPEAVVGQWSGDKWITMAINYKDSARAGGWTHFCRPIMPTPPKREGK